MYRLPDDDFLYLLRLVDLDGGFFGGSITPSVKIAERPSTKSSVGSSGSSGSSGGSDFLGTLGDLLGIGSSLSSLFHSKTGGERASDYTNRMVNEFLQNPARAMSLYNKNTDLTNEFFQNYMKAMTGAGLTTSQSQQNEFNAQQAQLQRDWATEMSSTQYQRTVTDMKAAGLNPAMMYGSSASPASTPSGSSASGGSPAVLGLGAIAELLNAASSARVARSSSALNYANVLKAQSETKLNEVKANTEGIRPEEIRQHIGLMAEQANTEKAKQALNEMSAKLADAQASQIEALTPFIKARMTAETARDRADANLALVHASWQQGLINRGMLDKLVEAQAGSNVLTKEQIVIAKEAAIKMIEDGKYSESMARYFDGKPAREQEEIEQKWFNIVSGAISTAADAYTPTMRPIGFK